MDVSKHLSAPFFFLSGDAKKNKKKPDSKALAFLFECMVPVFFCTDLSEL